MNKSEKDNLNNRLVYIYIYFFSFYLKCDKMLSNSYCTI